LATARAVHKMAKDGVLTMCGVRVNGNVQTKPTYRGVTCKRCLGKKTKGVKK
jgi:hypothetical protein